MARLTAAEPQISHPETEHNTACKLHMEITFVSTMSAKVTNDSSQMLKDLADNS